MGCAALVIAEEFDDIPELNLLLRIDDRLMASCCSTASRIDGIASICQQIRELESNRPSDSHWPHLDRDWIEQRVFSSEEEEYRPATEDQREHLHTILDEHQSSDCAAIIILGEADYCSQMMRHSDFPQSPRMPRETEFYMMRNYGTWKRKYIGAYSPRPRPVPTTQPTEANSSLTTAISAPGTRSSQSLTSNSQLSTSPPHQSADTTQTSESPAPRQSTPPPSPNAKRRRTSPSSEHEDGLDG